MRLIASLLALCLSCAAFAAARSDAPFVRQSVPQRWIEPILPEDLPELEYPQWANALDRARLEVFRGRYRKALLTLLETPEDADGAEVALVRSAALAATGRGEQALTALSDPAVASNPRVQVKRAEVLAGLGRSDEAIALLKRHLEQHPDSIAGRYHLAALYESVGNLEAAEQAYGWFIVEPQDFLARWQRDQEKAFDNAEEVVLIGRAIDRWATLTSAYQNLPNLHDALIGLFVRAYDVIDRAYWPAHVAAAEYFLSHDNAHQAEQELKAALAANPNDLRAREIVARVSIESWGFDAAEAQIAKIREVDPRSAVADLLEARNLLQQRRPALAMTPIQRILAKQPNHLQALGLLAATHALRLEDEQTAQVLQRIEKLDPDNASGYFEVAEQLGAMRQYPRAIAMYKVAIERAPWWTAARNGLGLLYTQSGDEAEAKATLDAAHAIDPYNLQTTNYLRLLEELDGFAKKETEHFIVMYDAKADPIIPEYFSEYLESIHAEVSRNYGAEPPVKTYIEVFPTHDAFSVRTTGSPWIGTVGASTGRVIALVTPRKGEVTMGAFNWANVLRHEYTHTITLAATDNRIPHWMTEGLAVVEERSPLKWEWVPMLYHAVTKDELFTMENLTWGFIRPKRPSDRSLAYAQSHWVCQYIEQTWGHDAILKLMAEFRNGATEQAAFQKILGKNTSEFESDFFAWARQQVATWGYDEQTSEKYEQLREKAEELVKGRQYAEALPLWQEIAAIRPVDALPHQRLAGLYLTKQVNEPEKAIEHLKHLHAVELKNNAYAKRISRLYRDLNRPDNAKSYAMQSVYIDPYDLDAHKLLLEVAEQADDQAAVSRERRVIPILEAWIEADRARKAQG